VEFLSCCDSKEIRNAFAAWEGVNLGVLDYLAWGRENLKLSLVRRTSYNMSGRRHGYEGIRQNPNAVILSTAMLVLNHRETFCELCRMIVAFYFSEHGIGRCIQKVEKMKGFTMVGAFVMPANG